ncbi:hypothetical protein M0802_007589 [Mischocyttarus mexicanus]|nr:hypothetical protein M0802_007589 [Mischocyttarus mexicanus]
MLFSFLKKCWCYLAFTRDHDGNDTSAITPSTAPVNAFLFGSPPWTPDSYCTAVEPHSTIAKRSLMAILDKNIAAGITTGNWWN